jgi:RNA polymerase sigma factor (sigma-70 family)
MDDAALLHAYAREHDQTAFAALVRRHVDLVHSAALRRTGGDERKAQDVTQQVFIDLARKAGSLARHPALPAWLHQSTRFAAANLQREEQRRRVRETSAALETETLFAPADSTADWAQLAPVLDAALDTLGETDRQTILLRYFAQKPFADIAAALGTTEAAAQMRATRALEKLRRALAARGVTSTASALGLALGANAVSAAPASVATATLAALASTTGTAAATASLLPLLTSFFTTMANSTKVTLGVTAALLVAASLGWSVFSPGQDKISGVDSAAEVTATPFTSSASANGPASAADSAATVTRPREVSISPSLWRALQDEKGDLSFEALAKDDSTLSPEAVALLEINADELRLSEEALRKTKNAIYRACRENFQVVRHDKDRAVLTLPPLAEGPKIKKSLLDDLGQILGKDRAAVLVRRINDESFMRFGAGTQTIEIVWEGDYVTIEHEFKDASRSGAEIRRSKRLPKLYEDLLAGP